MRARNRNWCFTINNFDETEEGLVIDLGDDQLNPEINRVIAEHEHLEEGTPHIQGYVSFYFPKLGEYVKNLLGGRAHVEPARGGWKQNVEYCTKENLIIVSKNCEINEINPLNTTKVSPLILENAKSMDPWTFEDTYPMIWFYHRTRILNLMMDYALRNVNTWNGDLKAKNYWIWGRPGIGKSKWASNLMSIKFQYKKAVNKWWDGFNLIIHKCVVLEDFPSNGQMFAQHLKIWGDRYSFMAECKGASMVIEPGRFFLIITSNYSIDNCFENPEDIDAIKRRFSEFECTDNSIQLLNALVPDQSILKH